MSVEILLIPIGLAALSAWRAHSGREATETPDRLVVPTRLLDLDTVDRAATAAGARTERVGERVIATWEGGSVSFAPGADGTIHAHTDDFGDVDAVALVTAVDAAYGLEVQRQVTARVHERAEGLGFRVQGQTVEPDGSVRITLEQQ